MLEPKSQDGGPALRSVDHIVDPQYLGDGPARPALQLAEQWGVVLRYRWSILAIALVAAGAGVLSAMSAVPLYRAEAKILVKFNQPNISNLQQFEGTPLHWLYFETQADIIKSRAIAERVVDRLHVPSTEKPPAAVRLQSTPEKWLRERIAGLVPDWRSWIPREWRTPEPPPPTPAAVRAGRVSSVMGGLSVTGGKESEVLAVSYVSSDPVQAARVINETAAAYIEFGLESRASNVQRTTVWLGERIEELREQLALSEAALRDFQAREGMVDTRSRESIISSKLGTLSAELIRAQSRRSEAQMRYGQVRKLLKDDADRDSLASSVLDSALVLEAHRDERDAERLLVELSERYGERHPKMIAATADLGEARRRFDLEVQKAADSARKDFDLAAAQERELERIIDAQHSEMRRLSGKAFELSKLEREVEANRNLYETFLGRFKEADIAGDYDVPQARVIDPATPPAYPFKPNKQRMVFIAVMLGLGVGVGLAFLRSHLDETFVTREQVEQVLRLPVLGQLPLLRGRASGRDAARSILETPRSPFAERINDVRTAIAFADVDRPPDAVLITSAVPGEGKTTLAVNLAIAFRQRGRTLLIDADLRKGRVAQVFDLGDRRGLSDLLGGACTSEEALVPIEEAPGLTVLTTGTLPPNPLELLSSKRFERLLRELREAFDYVVIDGSPLLPVSDSVVLGRQVSCVILALRADLTPHDAAREAVKRLQLSRIKPAGVVLQQVDLARSRSYSRRYASAYNRYYEYQPDGAKS